jgi:hypothetical protein
MDSKEERALLVHLPGKIVKFKQFSNGLYAMDPNDKTSFEMKKKPFQFLTTVKDNMKFLIKRQQEQATPQTRWGHFGLARCVRNSHTSGPRWGTNYLFRASCT